MGAGRVLTDARDLVADLGKWSRLGMHVKRWILLLVIACTGISLGIAFILVQLYRTQPFPEWVFYVTLQPVDRTWRALLFLTIGILGVGVAVVQLNRSLLLAVQPPYEQGRLVDLVYNYRLPQRRPRIVAFAGHRGFVALQTHRDRFGEKLLGIASIGDGLLPLGLDEPLVRSATDRMIRPLDEVLEVCAELEHGTILTGAPAIRARRGGVPIKRVFLTAVGQDPQSVIGGTTGLVTHTDAPVRAEAIHAIREADVIIFGPGSFYLSILPNLLLDEVAEAIRASKARKVLIANLMTEPGQTDLFDVGDYVRALHAYGGFTLDYVLVNSASADRVISERYAASLATPVVADSDRDVGGSRDTVGLGGGHTLKKIGVEDNAVILAADLATRMAERVPTPHGSRDATPGAPTTMSIVVYRHDPAKLASALATLLGVS
ncbi:MAG: hypothetical protein RL345_3018 [Chloroflexota bacterium]